MTSKAYSTMPSTLSSELSAAARLAAIEDNAVEEIAVMMSQEGSKYANKFDYLSIMNPPGSVASNDRVSEGWRRKICEWSFEVVDHFGFDREVVSIALDYLDRVVALKTHSSQEAMHRRDFQLIAVTCLYLAIKLHGETDSLDGPRRKLKIQAFVELSRGLFTVETLEAKEREILEELHWSVNPPSTVRIVATLLRLLPSWTAHGNGPVHGNTATALYEMARYLTELAVCVSTFSFNFKPSEIAYATILCSLEALEHKILIPFEVRIEFLKKITIATKHTPKGVVEICGLMRELCPSMFVETRRTNNATMYEITCEAALSTSSGDVSNEETARDSPVCVMTQFQGQSEESSPSPRKRGRDSK